MTERYEFIKRLPSGGFGNVIVLRDRQLNIEVVAKSLISPTAENRERFLREAKILNSLLYHEHVVDILGADFTTATPYILLEHCKHGTLQDWVTNRGLFGRGEWEVAFAVQHAALALHAIHELGGFHRDVKPSNLFIGENRLGQRMVKLGDFGLGRLPYPVTRGGITRHACGTEGYIAPELYAPNATFTAPCDVFSLGVTGIELYTGLRDRSALTASRMSDDLKNLLLRMTSLNPNERPSAIVVAATISSLEKARNENVKTAAMWGLGILGLGLLFGSGE